MTDESRDGPTVFVPVGVVLGRDTEGREITVDQVIGNPDLIDFVLPETLVPAGVRLLLEAGAQAFRKAEGRDGR